MFTFGSSDPQHLVVARTSAYYRLCSAAFGSFGLGEKQAPVHVRMAGMNEQRKSGGALAVIMAAGATIVGLALLCWVVFAFVWDSQISRRAAQARALEVRLQIEASEAARRAAEASTVTTEASADSATATTPEC